MIKNKNIQKMFLKNSKVKLFLPSFLCTIMVHVSTLKSINNANKGKHQVLIQPCSKVIIWFLTVMMKHG